VEEAGGKSKRPPVWEVVGTRGEKPACYRMSTTSELRTRRAAFTGDSVPPNRLEVNLTGTLAGVLELRRDRADERLGVATAEWGCTSMPETASRDERRTDTSPVDERYGENVSRREEIIEVAATILREEGPAALTSVEVASRVGVTQSAIYRHIVDMDELSGIASRIVVSELTSVFNSILLSPDVDFDELSGIADLSVKIIEAMRNEAQAFEVIDRWRFAEGSLGDGIRDVLATARDLLVFVLEREWRNEYAYTEPLPSALVQVQRAHAEVMLENVIAVARLVRAGGEPSAQARLLQLRIVTGWVGYVVDLQSRLDRPIPVIDVA